MQTVAWETKLPFALRHHENAFVEDETLMGDPDQSGHGRQSYRQILVTAGPVRRRRLRVEVRLFRRSPPARRRTSHPRSVLATEYDRRDGASFSARPRPA